MNKIMTDHARQRQQQRGVPPMIVDWLLHYGETTYIGRGAKARFFTKRRVRSLEKSMGRQIVRRMAEYMDCFLIQDNEEPVVITVGKRFDKTRFKENYTFWKNQ